MRRDAASVSGRPWKMPKNRPYFTFVLLLLWPSAFCLAQNDIPIGQWRTHFNYDQSFITTVFDEKVYSSASHSLLEVDLATQAVSKLSKANGLSDVGITALAAHAPSQSLVVGYANGNIDVLREGATYNLVEIKNANINTGKRINDIFFAENSMYVTTTFGMVEIDLETFDVLNTFGELGNNGTVMAVYNGEMKGDTIVLATENGILTASRASGMNLLDFRNWKRALQGVGRVDWVEASPETTYAATAQGRIWINEGNGWTEAVSSGAMSFLNLTNGELLYGIGNTLHRRAVDGQTLTSHLGIGASLAHAQVHNNVLWVADRQKGLGQVTTGGLVYFTSGGPAQKEIYRLQQFGSVTYTSGGGYDPGSLTPFGRTGSVSSFSIKGWQPVSTLALESFTDASHVLPSTDEGSAKVLVYGKGIFDSASGQLTDHTTSGSLLQSVNGFLPLTAMARDEDDNLLISSNQSGRKYMVLKEDGSWEFLDFIPESVPASIQLSQNTYGDFWGILPLSDRAGIIVFNEELRKYRLISTGAGLPSAQVNDIAFDRDGYAWLATPAGLAIVANTYEVLDLSGLLITYPVAENRFILNEETINTIAVDGANRKWIGTPRGLFLLDEFGAGSLISYTVENSPLPSNEVLDIEINQATGEVFVSTTAGLVSFRSSSSAPPRVVSQVKIFPNPVLPGYNGLVAIEGLAFDSVVKITDEAGRLVREMVSYGGTATWDLRDYNGARATSGVYLVFAASRDGSQAVVGKVAIIN